MKLIYSVYFAFILLFVGCGSDSDSRNTTVDESAETVVETYTVVDPYIKNATFFWDKDEDGVKDDDEPLSELSDENGTFEFDSNITIPDGSKIVMLDKGEHNGESYTGHLEAIISNTKVISPLTTIKSKYEDIDLVNALDEAGVSIEESDIDKDPMKSNNAKLIISSIATDIYLQVLDMQTVSSDENTFKDIVSVVGYLIKYDISNENIVNTVSITNYILKSIKDTGTLEELLKFKDEEYREEARDILKNRADKTKPGRLRDLRGEFRSEKAKLELGVLEGILDSFSRYPYKNQETTYSIDIESFPTSSTISWEVIEEPNDSNLSLDVSTDKKSVLFTPTVAGDYEIRLEVSTDTSSSVKTKRFILKEVFDLDISKVDGVSDDTNLSQHVGVVSNQTWVSSTSLNEDEITTILKTKKTLNPIGFDKTNGVLIEYDETDNTTIEDIEKLKYEKGIDNVFNRVYIGTDAIKTTAIEPNDNGAFNDGGDNWHLEAINMPEAWEYTTGTDNFFIGVIDSGFDNVHSDMQGRFATFLTADRGDHGMGVSGAIAANSDNSIGISGINWTTDIVASGLHYTSDIENVLDTTIDGKETKLLSNSWGLEYIPADFNPTNSSVAAARFDRTQNILAWIRQIVQTRTDKLFLWAAGNGVGNGGSTSGYYGVDAKYDNGGMVYENDSLSKLDNLLLVSAFIQIGGEKSLVYYSNYGESTDIASPTHFKSMRLSNGYYDTSAFNSANSDTTPVIGNVGFGGTSAATPVASAVASLIYSINPDLTPAEVKNILVSSATEFITKRQVSPYSENVENLAHPIPVLNAEEALKMAYATIHAEDPEPDEELTDDTTVGFKAEITDYFTPKVNLRYFSYDKNYKVTAISTILKSSIEQGSYSSFSTKSVDDSAIELTLDSSKRYHEVTSTLTLKHIVTGEIVTKTSIKEMNYTDLTITSVDFTDGSLVPNADFDVAYKTIIKDYSFDGSTNNSATAKVYLPYGHFKLSGYKDGYRDAKQTHDSNEPSSYEVDLPFGSTLGEAGAISGLVLDENGSGLSGVTVVIRNNTKDIDQVTTDSDGYYKLWNISKKDINSNLITNFVMKASKDGYGEVMKQRVIVLDGIEREENFTLIKEAEMEPLYVYAGEDITAEFDSLITIEASFSGGSGYYNFEFDWTDSKGELKNETSQVISKSDYSIGEHTITVTLTDTGTNRVVSDDVTLIITAEPTYAWEIIGDWGICTDNGAGSCDVIGTQLREVKCMSSIGEEASTEALCTDTKPVVSQECSMPECPFEFEEIVSPTTKRVWLDRNLGAKESCTQDRAEFDSDESYITSQKDCFGDYYQWGRATDGHQKEDSITTMTTSSAVDVSHGNFILENENSEDWTSSDEEGTQREENWLDSVGGICPDGYVVPTADEYKAELIEDYSDGFDKLKLPVAGYRESDILYKGDRGYIWTSTVLNVDSQFESISFNFYSNFKSYGIKKKVNGIPVRCIKALTPNLPPIADAGDDITSQEGAYVSIDGSLSSDPEGSDLTYLWEKNGVTLSTQSAFTINTLSQGLHQIMLTVMDDLNLSDTDTVLVNITSSDPAITYDWVYSSYSNCTGECGDNNGIQTRKASCKGSDGSPADDSLCDISTKEVLTKSCTASSCENQPPIANAGSNKTIIKDDSITLNGSGSYDTDGTIASYRWEDASGNLKSLDSSFSYLGNTVGSFQFKLLVTDDGGLTDDDFVTVTVIEQPAYSWSVGSWGTCEGDICGTGNGLQTRTVVCKDQSNTTVSSSNCDSETEPISQQSCEAFVCPEPENECAIANAGSNQTITYGDTVTLDGTGSKDNDGYIVSYDWSINSQTVSSSSSFTLSGLAVGAHSVKLTITDNDGCTDTDYITITVEEIPTDSYNWIIGSWGECIGECESDNGEQNRTVVCQKNDTAVTDQDCITNISAKPETTQSCKVEEKCVVDEDDDTIVSPVTGRTWLNKNLGASRVCQTMFDSECFGDYYQWGRGEDGHEKLSSLNSNSINENINSANSDFVVGLENNDFEWTNQDSSGDIRSTMWKLSNGTGICPEGFRVPTFSEIISENITSAQEAFENLKLPLAGERAYHNGNIYGENNYGGIWSTSNNGANSMFLFYSDNYSDWLYHTRAGGRSVRCIKSE